MQVPPQAGEVPCKGRGVEQKFFCVFVVTMFE